MFERWSAVGFWSGVGGGGGLKLMRGRWRWLWWLAADCASSLRFTLWHHCSWHVPADSAWMWIQQWDNNVVRLWRLGQFSFPLLLLFDHYTFFDTLLFVWYLSQDSCCWWGVGEDGWEVVCHRFLKRRRMVHWGWGEADEGQVEMVVVVGSWLHKFTKVYTMTPLFLACPGWQILDVNTKWDSNVVRLQRLGQFSFLLLLLFNHYTFFHTLLLFWYLSQDSCCWTVS